MQDPVLKGTFVTGNIRGGKQVKLFESKDNLCALWQITWNNLLPELLLTKFIDESPLIFLADSGSEINCVSSTLVEQIGYKEKIQTTKFCCCGLSGESLHKIGEIYLEFSLGNRFYTAKFIVMQLHSKTPGILGYNFMKSNNIVIHCGKAISNNPEFLPEEASNNNTDIEYLWVRPSMNYEIEQKYIRSIKLRIYDYLISMLSHFLITPFYIFKVSGQP